LAASEYFAKDSYKDRNMLPLVKQRTYLLRTLFDKVRVSDEMYIPSMLAVLHLLPETDQITGIEVQKRRVTYCDWSDKSNVLHPLSFNQLLPSVLSIARQRGCLFIRKVKCESSQQNDDLINDWIDLVLPPVLTETEKIPKTTGIYKEKVATYKMERQNIGMNKRKYDILSSSSCHL
jgi:hypothetical protein